MGCKGHDPRLWTDREATTCDSRIGQPLHLAQQSPMATVEAIEIANRNI